ncbi:DNA sulfur modification protein DndB [Zunongwangia sp. F363]|uniref:DNA sulfur modification protein DndB n=1 Tax=Autumnicola tepida TaxID=3075595 RepID=A0ABU3C749_9FLAO|nr:DNA sulfur modification protein DndB [Zunongwangia sp. F363]MDT0642173.1 DNA sulfur modification protein DndB [Zunongwangia sp. F363]
MKIPAIRSKIGEWTYYVTSLTFQQVSDHVSKVDEELHESEVLQDLIQRSITDNYLSIKEYILNQPEMFFNSLVLAVYNDYPKWQEIEVKYDNKETFKIGLLDFPGKHKIFPVDGQHRVEGIKEAIKAKPKMANNEIGVIFIGHSEEPQLKKRTRRLFTTLNRYAKPVSLRDIIALDEDDIVAILTRRLIEKFKLFNEEKIVDIKSKSIPSSNKKAFTSIITLYQVNLEICKFHYFQKTGLKPSKNRIEEFLKFRPDQDTIKDYYTFYLHFWTNFSAHLSAVKEFLNNERIPRDSQTGGNLLFRPIGILPFCKAVLRIKEAGEETFDEIFTNFNKANLDIAEEPWTRVLWDDVRKKMLMNAGTVTYLLLLYIYDSTILTQKEIEKLKDNYASKLGIEDPKEIKLILDSIPTLELS